MKILHTSDWHLGKKLEGNSRHSEQADVLNEIIGIADKEKVHAVIISGDIFDSFTPPIESLELFYRTVKNLSKNGERLVLVIAGNHDSPERLEAPDPLAKECGIIMIGYPNKKLSPFSLDSGIKITKSDFGFLEVKIPGTKTPLRLISTPYANEFRLKKFLGHEHPDKVLSSIIKEHWSILAKQYCDSKGINILATHLFMAKRGQKRAEETDDEKSILQIGGADLMYTDIIPNQINYTALGHIHRRMQLSSSPCPIIYPGSPLFYSFNDKDKQKSVTLIDFVKTYKVETDKIYLQKGKKLLKKRFKSTNEAVKWLTDNSEYWVELTLATDTYISAHDQKQIYNAHKGIVHLIPEIREFNEINESGHYIDLNKDIRSLFSDYFSFKYDIAPDKPLMEIFEEILKTG